MRPGSLSSSARVACHGRGDLVDVCMLVECTKRFVCIELAGVRIGGVYGNCGTRVYEMLC